MRLAAIQKEIAETQKAIDSLTGRLEKLQHERRQIRGRAFVAVNGIRRADLEMSDGPGKPFFGHVRAFAEWLRENSDKTWAEWNTIIYNAGDLKVGRMPPDMPATLDDLTD